MELSNTLKSRFCKDYNLPIQVLHEPYFTYYVSELDKHFSTKHKLKMLTDVVTNLGNEQLFFEESSKVRHEIIYAIQHTDSYIALQQNKLDEYTVTNGINQKNIYNMEHVGKTFISIDLKHANFNVFRMFDPSLVLDCKTYEDLIGTVTDFEYFKKSKYVRQVIFGNLLPKKQQKLQHWVINKIITILKDELGLKNDRFISASSDEVIILVDVETVNEFRDTLNYTLSVNSETKKCYDWFKIEAFTLKSIGDRQFFVKESSDDSEIDFKNIQSYFFMQVFKKYYELPVNTMDKMFYFDGELATFNEGLFDENA